MNQGLRQLCREHPDEGLVLLTLLKEVLELPDLGAGPVLKSEDLRARVWGRRIVERVDFLRGLLYQLDLTDIAPEREVVDQLRERGLLYRAPDDELCGAGAREAGSDLEAE